MDWRRLIQKGKEAFEKYRLFVLLLLAGVLLLSFPGKQESQSQNPEPVETAESDLADDLSRLLSQMEGAGKVRVLLTEAVGAETLYQTDENSSSDALRLETVVVTDAARVQSGLIRQRNPPRYQGAVVLCQGAGSAAVRLAIVEAVADAAGLGYDKITVLKMK